MLIIKLDLHIRVAVIEAERLTVTEARTAYEKLEACATTYRERYGDVAPAAIDGVQVARRLFRALGIDPTKTRPSSEALLRRALKGKALYHINNLVDVGNWVSLDFLLPLGLYDRAKIQGAVTLRKGKEGEQYEGINRPPINVAGRYVLADEVGPFGNPSADSQRTCITAQTTEAVMVLIAPGDYPAETLQSQAATGGKRIVEICGGEVARVEVVDGVEI